MAGRFNELASWLVNIDDKRIEVVIVHDVGDDTTECELHLLLSAARIKQIKCISGRFGSPGSARNRGFADTRGKWVMFVDSDDVPDVKNVLDAIEVEKRNPDAIVGRYLTYDRVNSKMTQCVPWRSCYEQLALNPGVWRIVFLREAIERLTFTNLLMAEDQIFLAQFNPSTRKMVFVNDNFYTYYVGDAKQATRNPKSLADLSKAMQLTAALVRSRDREEIQFLGILMNRQLVTSLRRAPFVTKLRSLSIYVGLIIRVGPHRAVILTKKFFMIFTYLRSTNAD